MEVLSPVKNYDVARVAIQSGCDAIYLGSPHFSARNKVNLDYEQLELIINYANMYGVKTFIAFNTVIFQEEVETFLNEIVSVYNLGCTGIILQDFSFGKIIKNLCPNLELHVSTQMNVHNNSAINLVKEYGFNRVVVPREMSFNRIKNIKNSIDIEIEAFIHGAICVSYSGQCYDSVLLDQKSANRGRCSQYCRFEQSVFKNDKKINSLNLALNIKDMNNLELLEKYKDAGVDSIKIEGRLKNLDYVGTTISNYSNNSKQHSLDSVYNREFTNGLINSTKTKELVNNKRINNTGKYIGEIVDKYTNTNKQYSYYSSVIVINNTQLIRGDNIRFVNSNSEDGQVIEQIEYKDSKSYIYTNSKVNKGYEVYKTFDKNLFNYYNTLKNNYERRVNIDVSLSIFDNYITFIVDNKFYELNIETSQATKNSINENYLNTLLCKTSNTPFDLNVSYEYIEPNLYLSNKNIKYLKNYIINSIIENRTVTRNSTMNYNVNNEIFSSDEEKRYFIEVKNINQYNEAVKYCNNIIISDFEFASSLTSTDNLILKLPSVIYEDEYRQYDNIIDKFDTLLVSELGSYYKYKDTHKLISNYTLNSTNKINLEQLDCNYNILSLEVDSSRINSMCNSKSMVMLYGYIPVMTMDYCPINLNKQDGCEDCRLCRNNEYYVKDFKGRKFNLVHEDIDKLTLNSEQPLYLNEQLHKINVNNFLIKFTSENSEMCNSVLESIFNKKRVSFSYYDKIVDKEVL